MRTARRVMGVRQRVALIAHDHRKTDLRDWARGPRRCRRGSAGRRRALMEEEYERLLIDVPALD